MSSTPQSPAGKSTRRRQTPPTNPAARQQTEFGSFAETTSAAIFITQGRGVLYANSAASKSTGYTREELLGMELWQIAHPNYQPALKQLGTTHAWVEHIPSRYEIKIITKAGEENWLDVTLGDIDYKGEPAIAVTAFDITERDRAERALRKAHAELEARVQERTSELAAVNERLQSVLDTIAEAYVAFDSDWRFVTLNHVAEIRIFDRPASELMGKVIWDEYPQTVGQEVHRQYHLAVETGQPVHFETPSRIVPGRWFEVHAYPRGDGLEVYSRDITERRQAQEEIASLAKFPSENPNPVLRLNAAGEVLYANKASRTLLQAWARTTGDTMLSYWHSLAAQAAANQANQTVDTECDGRAYSFFITPIVEAGYVNFYGRDTTERTQAEEALHESEERYRLLFDNSLDGILLTTPDGGIQAANAAACRMFGRTEEEICRVGRTGVVDVSDPRVAAAVEERARTGKFHSEMFLLRADGTRFQGDASSMMFTGKDGRLRTSIIVRDITEQKRAEAALRESEERFRIALQNSPITVATLDRDLRYTWVYNTRHGFDPAQVLGKRPDELIAPEEARELMVLLQRALETGHTKRNEVSGRTRGQRWVYDVTAEPLRDTSGRVIGLTITNIDITERIEKEAELHKLNRALRALSNINQTLMRVEDETRLLDEVCTIVVRDCGYPMVWIGFAEQDEAKTVRPVAYAGFEAGYLETLKISWADTERGRGPTGTAIRTGRPSGCSNMLTDPDFTPWRAEAIKRGYASSLVLPLLAADRAFGAVTIYSREPDSFSEEEVALLTELAGDLVYGLTTLRLHVAHAQSEEALRLSEERYRALFTSMTEGFALHEIICDEQGVPNDYCFLEINPSFERLTGLRREDVIGKTHNEVLPNDDPRWVKMYGEVALTGQPVQFENYSPELDRHYAVFAYRPAPRQFAVLFMDITDRERMDEALRSARDELEIRVQERTQELAQANEELRLQMAAVRAAANGIVITDRQGGIQWCNPAFTDMTGYTAEEVLGKNLRLLNSGQQSADFYRQLWTTILAGDVWRGELTNRRKDGRLYVEEQTIAPVLNGQREITHFIAVKQDITPRQQAAERLARYNQDLLALSKAERDQRQLAETLTAANLALVQSLNLETVLETLLDCVAQLVPYDSANVMLLESESRLAVRVTRGYEHWTNAELVRAITFDAQVSPMLNALLTTRHSCLVPDTRLEPGWQTPLGVEHVRNWLGVPLMAGGNVIGIYSLDKAEPGFFTAEHVRMTEMLVGQAAVAIQNAWLFEQVRAGRERLQSLSRRLVEIQEAERHYVARELHDEAGQALTSLLFGLGQLEQQLNDPGQANQVIELKHMTNGVLDSLHRLAMDLRPASLDHLGLVPALAQYVKALGDRYGLIAQFKTMSFEGERLSADVETALYRIVQEALTNVVRHARATRADVLLERRGDHVVVVIEDNGRGFAADIAYVAQQGHLGLVGMQERAEMLGGSLVIESTAGTGTTIVVEVPDDHSHLDR